MDILPKAMQLRDVMPVGRLDKDTTGLLLFTSDGTLCHRLLAPKTHVWKEYLATVDGELTEEHIVVFRQGVPLKNFTALPAELLVLSASATESCAKVRIREGKYHQIKRMFGALQLRVTALHRQAFGAVDIGYPMRRIPSAAQGRDCRAVPGGRDGWGRATWLIIILRKHRKASTNRFRSRPSIAART